MLIMCMTSSDALDLVDTAFHKKCWIEYTAKCKYNTKSTIFVQTVSMQFFFIPSTEKLQNYYTQFILCTEEYSPPFYFSPLALGGSWWISDWVNSNVLNYLSLNTSMSGQIKDGAKPFVSEERWK